MTQPNAESVAGRLAGEIATDLRAGARWGLGLDLQGGAVLVKADHERQLRASVGAGLGVFLEL